VSGSVVVVGVVSGSTVIISSGTTATFSSNSMLNLTGALIIQPNAALVYSGNVTGAFVIVSAASISGTFASATTVDSSVCVESLSYAGASVLLTINNSCGGGISTG
jgi:hypothetical protein